jgi:HK97 family phage major capsid protein
MSLALRLRAERAAVSTEMGFALERNDMSRWKALDEKQESLRLQVEGLEAAERSSGVSVPTIRRPNIGGEYEEERSSLSPHFHARSTPGYKREFKTWLETGERGAELRAIGVGGDGSTLVPTGFEQELETKLKYYGGLYNICRQITTATGNPLHYPTVDDTSNTGEWLAETAGVGTADPTFSEVVFGANLLSSKQVKVSVQLEQDSAFPLDAVLSDAFGERLGRSLDTALWTGDGSTIPVTGLLTALQAAGGRSVLAVGANANDGVSNDLNSIGTDDFSALIDKLDRAYQKPTNRFVFNQSTQNALRKLKDKYGRPAWEVSLAQGNPDTIFGFGFTIDNAFANIGAGNVSAAFGDPTKYVIRRALGFTLVRFNELYMANYQRAFQAFMRVDAKLLQPAAWSYLTHPLS